MLPFWDIYGYGLYAGTPFYGTPKKIYNQTAVTYNRRFFNNTVGVFRPDSISITTAWAWACSRS